MTRFTTRFVLVACVALPVVAAFGGYGLRWF